MSVATYTAQSASAFLDSIGVTVHMSYTWTSYGNVQVVENSLAYIGVDNLRDKLVGQTQDQQLASAGYKFDFFLPETISPDQYVSVLNAFVEANPGSVTAIEGPNEVAIWPAAFDGGTSLADEANLQRAFFTAIKA